MWTQMGFSLFIFILLFFNPDPKTCSLILERGEGGREGGAPVSGLCPDGLAEPAAQLRA